ncbi:MAG: YicC/YloC family endoribonuclease [Planctomycetota bacterium]
MTGFGEAHTQRDGLAVGVEVRTINSRFFKLSTRLSEGYGLLEPHIEGLVRKAIRRGTVQVNVRLDRTRSADDFQINATVLERYRRQIDRLQQQWNLNNEVPLSSMLQLPGVVDEGAAAFHDALEDWPAVSDTVRSALDNLGSMRVNEGLAMAQDLERNCRTVGECLKQIRLRAPCVVEEYRARLEERLRKILAEFQITLDPADVIREVSLMADRADISEEIVRLESHVEQFLAIMELPESSGRKLEFLTQEMFREANTIGSKSSDVEIARSVIEIKTAIERIREMIQNVE